MSAGGGLLPVDPSFAHETITSAASATSPTERRSLESRTGRSCTALLIKLQHRHEGFLRNLDRSHPLHFSLAFLLLFDHLPLPLDVSPIPLAEDFLSHR